MALTSEQISHLVAMVITVQPDDVDCEVCFGRVAEFAQLQLTGGSLDEGLRAIERHVQQCPCCRDEYQALLDGLRALDLGG